MVQNRQNNSWKLLTISGQSKQALGMLLILKHSKMNGMLCLYVYCYWDFESFCTTCKVCLKQWDMNYESIYHNVESF